MRPFCLVAVLLLLPRLLPAQEEPAPQQPAAEETDEALPKLSDLKTPTMEELLKNPPADWIVLHTERVIVTQPVSPRPDTLKKMEAIFQESFKWPRATSKEEIEEQRAKRDALNYLDIYLPAGGENPEFRLHKRFIKEIIYHEDLMLRRIDQLLTAGKLRDAFEMLFILERRIPDYTGTEERRNRLLFREAEADLQKEQPESALVRLEELHARQSDFPGLDAQFSVAADLLIAGAVQEEDYRRARHFLGRLLKRVPNNARAVEFRDQLQQRAATFLAQAQEAAANGRHDAAVPLIETAAMAWPATPGLRDAHRRIVTRFQSLKVGVLNLPGEPTAYFLPTDADERHSRLTEIELFEVDRVDERPHYRTPFFEQWEPTDLGRQIIFTLRPNRQYWESQPVATAGAVVSTLAGRLDPSGPDYDERFASFADSLVVHSPYEFAVHFSRVPLRTEPLFRLPLNGSNGNESDGSGTDQALAQRFRLFERTDERAVYRRAFPEPDNVSQHHLAEIVEIKYPSTAKALQALLRGEISMLPHVESWYAARLRGDNRFYVQPYALPTTHVVQVNPASKPLRNRELRRALIYALDRPRMLSEVVLRDTAAGAGRVVSAPYSTKSYAYNARVAPREYDLALAFSLAIVGKKSLGGEIPKLKMVVAPDPVARAAAEALVAQWAKIGVPVELVAEAGDQQALAEWDLVYRTVRMAEPLTELWPFLTFESRARIEALTYLPDWLRQELVELDQVGNWNSAVEILHRLHRHLWAEAELIPLWEVDDFLVIRNNIQGISPRPLHPYYGVERWALKPWFETEAP